MKKKTRLMALLLCALMLFQTTAFAETSSVVDAGAVTEELYQGWVETATAYAVDSESENDYYLDVSNYYTTPVVLWDAKNPDAKESLTGSQEGSHISSVTLAGETVNWSNSDNSSPSSGSTLATYYEGITAGTESYKTLSIVAEEGYYVTKITIACDPASGATPYDCSTWENGEAFIQNFNLTESTYANGVYTLNFSVSNKYFSHNAKSAAEAYYILIETAQVPTPLYVEYNYGNVTDFLTVDSNSAFYNPTWTVKSASNNYGTGGVYTVDTQFAYGYSSDDISAISSWTHTANSVSDAALAEAAALGYYFAGWAVTWYNDCSVSDTANEYRDTYTFTFSEEYMTGSYQPGESVQLPTHVRLVAQWVPISLKVTKTVEGLASISEHSTAENTFKVTLSKTDAAEGDRFETVELQFTITGDGSLTYTVAASGADQTAVITPGTYTIVEAAPEDLEGQTENAYCSVTYPDRTVTVAADGTVQELSVLNTYSSTPATVSVTIEKQVTGNMGDRSKEFSFVVKDADGKELGTLSLAHGETAQIEGVTIGTNITITETTDGYSASYAPHDSSANAAEVSEADGVAVYTISGSGAHIVCTNEKNETVDTGILLDSLPYVLILMLVGGGAVLWGFNRRRRRED